GDDSQEIVVPVRWSVRISEVDTGRWRYEEWRVGDQHKITAVHLYTPEHLMGEPASRDRIDLVGDDIAELDLANKHHLVEGTAVIGKILRALRAAMGDKEYLFWEPAIHDEFINKDAFASLVIRAHTALETGDWQSLPRLMLRQGDRYLNLAFGAEPYGA